MKTILLATALVLGVAAQAAPLKTYDCSAPRQSNILPDQITVQANQDNLVFSFPGWSATEYEQPVAGRNVGAGDNGGASFDLTKNANEFLVGYRAYQYKITEIRASNGIMRADGSGTLTISYDDVTTAGSGSRSRDYACTARVE